MKQLLITSLSSMLLFSPIVSVQAADPVDECSKELLLSYFPEPFVRQTLKANNVPQEKWDAIVTELKNNDKQVVGMVEEKAAKMTPNPLKNPSDQEKRQKAVAIFRETLTQVFTAAMNKNGITDQTLIQTMLDDVQHQKASRFKECLEKHKNSVNADANVPPTTPTSTNAAQPEIPGNTIKINLDQSPVPVTPTNGQLNSSLNSSQNSWKQ